MRPVSDAEYQKALEGHRSATAGGVSRNALAGVADAAEAYLSPVTGLVTAARYAKDYLTNPEATYERPYRGTIDATGLAARLGLEGPSSPAERIVRSTVRGAAAGFPSFLGGPVAGIANVLGGGAGGLAEGALHESGAGPITSGAGGFAADLAVSALAGRRLPAFGGRSAADAIYQKLSPQARAARVVEGTGVYPAEFGISDVPAALPDASDVVTGARAGYGGLGGESADLGSLVGREKQAWKAASAANEGTLASAAPLEQEIDALLYEGRAGAESPLPGRLDSYLDAAAPRAVVADAAGKHPTMLGVDDVQAVLHQVSLDDLKARAGDPSARVRGRARARIRDASMRVLDDLASQSDEASESVASLRIARAKTAQRAEAAKGVVGETLLSDIPFDNPRLAMTKILSSPRAVPEVDRLMLSIDAIEDPKTRAAAKAGLKRSAIEMIFERQPGAGVQLESGAVAKSAGAITTKAAKHEPVLRHILGDGTYSKIVAEANALYRGSKAGYGMAPLLEIAGIRASGRAAVLASAGGVVGGTYGAAVGAVIGYASERLSRNRVRELALAGIADPSVGHKLLRKLGRARSDSVVRAAIMTSIRRGLLEPIVLDEYDATAN